MIRRNLAATYSGSLAPLLILAALAAAEPLLRKDIYRGFERGAVCNDFTVASFYLSQSTNSHPGRWIIHFEGGGGCSNFSDCNKRWVEDEGSNQVLMSSKELPNTVEGADLLSPDPDRNGMFHDYTHVLVPYCSSDAWLANRTNERFSQERSFHFDDSDNADNFVYMGQTIFQAVMEDLLDLGLRNASELILAGSSAGGIGVLNHLKWVESLLPNASIRVITDSSWFVGFTGYHAFQFSEEAVRALIFAHPACQDLSLGYPCCMSPACLFSKGYMDSTDVPILVISSLYDIFTLESPLREIIQEEGVNDQTLLALFNGYGSVINESLIQSHSAYPQLSIYAPSCSQHVHMATSSLWHSDGLLNATVDGVYHESSFQLTNPIQSGNWERLKVTTSEGKSFTLLEAIELWNNDTSQRFFLTDGCSGPACDGTCPSKISIIPEKHLWPVGYQYVVLTLSALMTLIPIVIKLSIYVYMEYMLYRQKVFAYDMDSSNKNKPRFPKPTHAVNVSCIQLSYHISLVGGGEVKRVSSERADSKQFSSMQHYHTHARMEAFLPCYKKLCSKLYVKWASRRRVSNPRNSQVEILSNHRQRPDSGISSEIAHGPLNSSRRDQRTSEGGGSSNSSLRDFDTASLFSSTAGEWGRGYRSHRKTILNQVNMYINPGELVAIMGPSGSGKTTLLDVLLNKRTTGTIQGEILINGTRLSKMRRWFVSNTGYVRQLASYYYNELTVRENLLFSMNMQAMRGMSLKHKLERVEQVIREMGLQDQANVIVGDTVSGLGLSGGQRKRLAIAVQLLSVPNILFLDEPTSGLDSASSLEILKSLQVLAETGRAVVVTIHQPRSEIFLAFDKILLLCNGQVAFFGSPVKVWDFFSHALEIEDELQSDGGNSSNTADRILDLLKEKRRQQKVLQVYRKCGEPEKVKNAVEKGKDNSEHVPLPLDSRNPGFWHRLVSLEARASLRQNIFTIIYLPIVYLVFGAILGTTYLFTDTPVQIMSVTCLLSCSSSLFMSSIILSLLVEPLKLFQLEHSDGISNAYELTLQVFIRMSAVCTFPLSICATTVFFLVYQNYSIEVYFVVLLAFLLVNQCWLSLFILFTVTYPQQAHRLCPVFAAIGGFCCGFIVPKPLMPAYYSWIFFINPSYYAYAATTVTVLTDNDLGCSRDSPLECFRDSNVATLQYFGLEEVNPIENMVVLIGMVWVLLILATSVLHLKVTLPVLKEKSRALWGRLVSKKCQTRVHSTDAGHSSTTLSNVSNGHLPTYESIIELENIDTTLEPHPLSSVSTDLLLDGKHNVVMTFPWEKPHPMEETDFQPPPVAPPSSAPLSKPTKEAWKGSASAGLERGREKRRSKRKKDTVVQITMEDEGMDEDERRRIAEQKWQQRRSGIETELLRLKHSRQNRERARRHSDTNLAKDLYDPQRQPRRTLSSHAGLRTKGIRHSSSSANRQGQHRSSYNRSLSVQVEENDGQLKPWRSRLMSHKEVDEEEEEEEVVLGLPPKDVPDFEPKFREPPSALDMSQIPMEEIAMIPELGSPGPWNTGGEQDSPF